MSGLQASKHVMQSPAVCFVKRLFPAACMMSSGSDSSDLGIITPHHENSGTIEICFQILIFHILQVH